MDPSESTTSTGRPQGGRARTLRAVAVLLALVALGRLVTREQAERIVVSKSGRTLTAYDRDGAVVRRFAIGLGRNEDGPKRREGDERTPEGEYFVCFKNTRSRFHLSLGLSYPGPSDAARGVADGVIGEAEAQAIVEAHRKKTIPPWKTALGGEIFIHGGLETHGATRGCIALTNRDVEELFPMVALGTPVVIEP